jgi:hypothetical protein
MRLLKGGIVGIGSIVKDAKSTALLILKSDDREG